MTTKPVFKTLKVINSDAIWHPDTALVFRSTKDKRCIGKYVDKVLVPLSQDDLVICETWRFKVDETCVEKKNEESHKEVNDTEKESDNEDNNDTEKKVEPCKETKTKEKKSTYIPVSFDDIGRCVSDLVLAFKGSSEIDSALDENTFLREENKSLHEEIKSLNLKLSDANQVKSQLEEMKKSFELQTIKFNKLKEALSD